MPIKRSDIEKGDVFGGLGESAEKNKPKVEQLEILMKSIIQLAKGIKTSLSSIKPINSKAIREHNTLTKNANTLTSETIRINKQLEGLKQAKIRTQQTELRLTEQQKRAQEKEAKAAKKATIEKQKQTNAYLIQGKRIRELTAQYRNLFIAEGKETRQTRKLKAEILSLNKVRNKANENLGQHQNKVGQYGRAIAKLRGGLAQLGLAFGVFRVLRNVGSTIVDFDTALTDLSAISGKTKDELQPLTDQALELGATTQFTASEITNLQIELAKLGFTADEITNSTGPISRFATATGAEIPEAAQLAGSALRAFGLDAAEMERVVSVMGVATTKTGLDFQFLQTAMSTIAPVANAFGFSIEDTTALLGQLANSGFDASSAATATRNILLNLADANGDLAKSLGHPVTNADELAGALSELQNKGVDLATALELTDKRSVAAFETFLKGSDSLVELRDSITDVSGELEAMSDKRLDSIAGATDLLKSAWEGLILEWSKGEGAGEKIKNVITFIAENLRTLLKVVGAGIKWFLTYRLQVALLGKEFAKLSFGEVAAKMGMMIKNIPNLIKGFKLSTISVKSFGKALGRIPFVQIISALVTIGPMLIEFVSNLFNGAEATTRLQDATAKANNEIIKEKAGMESLFQQLKKTNNGTQERADLIDRINSEYGTTLKNLSDETEFARQLEQVYDDLNAQLERKIKLQVFNDELVKIIGEELRLRKAIEQAVTGQTITDEELRKARDVGGTQFLVDVLKKTVDEKKGVFDAINELSDLGGEIKKTTPDRPGAKGVEETTEEEERKAKKALTKAQQLTAFKKTQATELAEFENELLRRTDLDAESRAILLAQKEIELARETGRKIIELDFDDKGVLIKHENDYLKKVESLEDQKLAYYKKTGEEIKDNSLENLQDQINEEEALRKKAAAEEEQALRDRAQAREDIIGTSTDKILELADERISKIDQEIAASDRQAALLETRAADGNIAAQESLAAQNQIKAEAEARKQKIERQKQQVELVSAFVTAYSNALGEGKSAPEALQEAALGTGGVQAFISSIPSFMDGVEDTGTHGYGVDGKGGFNAVLHPNERVMTKQQNAMIGGYSNEDVAKIMFNHRTEGLQGASQKPYQAVIDLSKLEAKMADVVEAVKGIPENKTEIGRITSTYMKISEGRKSGNTTTTNRFKVG